MEEEHGDGSTKKEEPLTILPFFYIIWYFKISINMKPIYIILDFIWVSHNYIFVSSCQTSSLQLIKMNISFNY